jgi:hypothetical protein
MSGRGFDGECARLRHFVLVVRADVCRRVAPPMRGAATHQAKEHCQLYATSAQRKCIYLYSVIAGILVDVFMNALHENT